LNHFTSWRAEPRNGRADFPFRGEPQSPKNFAHPQKVVITMNAFKQGDMMKTIGLCELTACVVVLLAVGYGVHSRAAAPEMAKPEHSLSHFVRFETGGTWLRDSDNITIDEIHGTSDKIEPGNLYEIKGTYALASHDRANLEVEVTSRNPAHDPHLRTQSMVADRGDGHFTLYWYFWSDGNPHLSFYPAGGGSSFASVYFGTGENVLKHASWLDDPAPAR
jgi:hypothetical protein